MEKWLDILEKIHNKLLENVNLLNELDQKIGDGDHGTNLIRGIKAICEEKKHFNLTDNREVIRNCGLILLKTVGGAGGSLLATFLLKMSEVMDNSNNKENWYQAIVAGYNAVKIRGKSDVGEKTMLDALFPVINSFKKNIHLATKDLLFELVKAANQGAESTIPLIAKKGRASYLGIRSIGHMDAGAKSVTLIIEAIATVKW